MSQTKYEFTIVIKRTVDFSEPGYWDAHTPEEAAEQESRLLQGEKGYGDYLLFALESQDSSVAEISYKPVDDE